MDLKHQNKEALAGCTVKLLTVHILIALAYSWYLILNTGFFGGGIGGWVVALLALAFFLGVVPAGLYLGLKVVLQNILDKQWISLPGCTMGIVLFICEAAYAVWALNRDLQSAFWVFLLAPLPALIFAFIVTLLYPIINRFFKR